MAPQADAPSTTPSVQVVGNAFVEQYYHILHHSPDMVHKFYQDPSFISRPEEDGKMITVTTMKGINDKICSMDYTTYKAEIKTADAQESYKDGVIVLVTGFLTRKEDNRRRKFIQSFFLAPQDKGYFVLNDVFRYVDESKPIEDNPVVVEVIEDKQTTPLIPDPPRTIDSPSPYFASVHKDEAPIVEEKAREVLENEGSSANENNSVRPEPNPSENNISPVLEPISSTAEEDTPKKSYASILSSQTKKGPAKAHVPVKTTPTKTESKPAATLSQGPSTEVTASIASSSIISPDGDGHSVYVRNLPLNATVVELETEFKKFGPIKQGGIQVRSNKMGYCFGFVEFQDLSSMQNAIQVIEDKQTTPLIPDPPRTIDSPSPYFASVHKDEAPIVEEKAREVLENEGSSANENNSVRPEPNPSENNISPVLEPISSTAEEDTPKKSYASILSSQTKKGPAKAHVPVKTTPTKTESKPAATLSQGPSTEVTASIASSSIISPDGDGHSVYVRNLPLNATVVELETEFKKFGPIKQGGIQVRSNKMGYCFGFVEFQDLSSMQNAIQLGLDVVRSLRRGVVPKRQFRGNVLGGFIQWARLW
ncbi:Nuclear transport factor 2 [Artemisia annua]|uniref:Nuclear transport factor 2 n=1 Tax=Artemisia annua TaxID=35608 RepID=A0A2U1PVJ3_ARTAN|nr:Nuclear transport factor 2 [Artemisia annua]